MRLAEESVVSPKYVAPSLRFRNGDASTPILEWIQSLSRYNATIVADSSLFAGGEQR